jgi:hypothetical protein
MIKLLKALVFNMSKNAQCKQKKLAMFENHLLMWVKINNAKKIIKK